MSCTKCRPPLDDQAVLEALAARAGMPILREFVQALFAFERNDWSGETMLVADVGHGKQPKWRAKSTVTVLGGPR